MPGFLTIARAIGIRGGIAILLAIALGITMWRADAISGQRDEAIQGKANEAAAHSVTKASLALLEEKLATYIKDGERRQKAAQDALEAQQERSASLDRQIGAIRSQRASTPAVVERCETPEVVLSAEGL